MAPVLLPVVAVVAIVAAVALVAIGLSLRRLVVVCAPSQVAIFSGPARRDDQPVGYRGIRGGRGLRIPLLEKVEFMDVTNMVVGVAVTGAYSRDGIPLNVEGVANIKIDGDPPGLDHAVERLLGKTHDEIIALARDTLEGNLRGVLARLTPQEVNDDKEKFAAELIEEAAVDLHTLGLSLDTLKIQTVSDDVAYLDAIGRIQSALLLRNARKAEASRASQSEVEQAQNLVRTRNAQLDADRAVAEAEAERRVLAATTRRAAVVAQQRGLIASQLARAQADVLVQTARGEQVRLKLEADVIAPAYAYESHKRSRARADAAAIREHGEATARGMKALAASWLAAGGQAREIVVMDKLRTLTSLLVGTVGRVEVDRLTVVGDTASSSAGAVAGMLEQLRSASDVDLSALAKRVAAGESRSSEGRGGPGL